MNRVMRIVAIVLAVLVLGGSLVTGHWRFAIGALLVLALELFWLVRGRIPLRIKRKPLRIGSGGGRG